MVGLHIAGGLTDVRITRSHAPDVWYRVAGRELHWSSTASNVRLRITYQDSLGGLASTVNACRWRIMVDGNQVAYFSVGDIDGTHGWHIDNGAHVAWVLNVPPGAHDVYVEAQRSLYAVECLSGWNTVGSFLSVEEIP